MAREPRFHLCILALVVASCGSAPPAAPPSPVDEAADGEEPADPEPVVAYPGDPPGTWAALDLSETGGRALSAARMAANFVLDRDCLLDHVAIGVSQMGAPCWTVGVELLVGGAAVPGAPLLATTNFPAADAGPWNDLGLGTVPLVAGVTYTLRLTDLELPQLPGSLVLWRVASTDHAGVTAGYSALPPKEDWVGFGGDFALVVACRDAVPDVQADASPEAAGPRSGAGTPAARTAPTAAVDRADRGPLPPDGSLDVRTFVLDRDCVLDHVSIRLPPQGRADGTLIATILEPGDDPSDDVVLATARLQAADETVGLDLDLGAVRLAAGIPYELRLQDVQTGVARDFAFTVTCRDDGADLDGDAWTGPPDGG